MEREFKGKSIRKIIENYTVIDLETTGKNILECDIIEFGAVRVRGGKVVSTFSQLIKPIRKLPKEIIKITGITDEMLKNAPTIQEVIENYISFIGNDVVVGHNVSSFDVNLIYDAYEKHCNKYFKNDMIDTYHFAKCCDIEVPNYKLSTISEYLGIECEAHRALGDCIANAKCYEFLKGKYTGVYNTEFPEKKNGDISKGLDIEDNLDLDIVGKQICLTGDFACGLRSEISSNLEKKGAIIQKNVTSKTDYLIVGNNGNSDWAYGNYGTKVKKALELQEKGKDIKIVRERDFFHD